MLTVPQRLLNDIKIADAAVACETLTGCPAPLSMAQCQFESAHLERCPKNNCFGIKADHRGSGEQYVLTHEYLNGQWKEMLLAFEAYDSLADCFADHARLIQTGVYAPAWEAYKSSHDLRSYVQGVAAHYATDPSYFDLIEAQTRCSSVTAALAAARQRAAA